jgi:hypothetical protein
MAALWSAQGVSAGPVSHAQEMEGEVWVCLPGQSALLPVQWSYACLHSIPRTLVSGALEI